MADQDYYNGEGYNQETMDTNDQGGANGTGDKINASKNDDDDRKIFVGGLSWETTVKDIKEYFNKFGDVADCTLKTDPTTGRSRGFAFVLFSESPSVEKVLAEKAHLLHGRNIDPKRAKARGGREPILKVFVGGLDPTVPESDIKDYFSTFGKVTEIELPYDKAKSQRRAFCFVSFESESIVDKVCEQSKQDIGGRRVDIKKATPKQDNFGWGGRGGRGGFGGGGGRGGGRGRGRGGYNNWEGYGGGYGGYGSGYEGYGSGYDYNQGYGSGYGSGYDYNNYYGNQGWGGNGYGGSGYGSQGSYDNYNSGYDSWGYDGGQGGQQGGYGKAKTGGRGGSGGYHPYSR